MNQKAKKIIKASLCNRDDWIKDSDAKTCFKCDQRFNILIRRRHHCRACGFLFCQECAQFFLKGSDINEDESQIRFCESCYKKCWKYIMENDKEYYRKQKLNHQATIEYLERSPRFLVRNSSNQSKQQNTKVKLIKKITQQYQQKQTIVIQSLKNQVQDKISLLVQIMIKENKLPMQLWDPLFQLTKKILEIIPANGMITKNMNINKHLMIRCFKNQEYTIGKQIVGVVAKKINISKKFYNNDLKNQSVMLIYGNISIDEIAGKRQLSFQQIIQNRKLIQSKLVEKINQLEVGIILLEQNIQKQLLDMFAVREIIVINKVRVQDLSRIKTCLGIKKIVDDISKISEYKRQEILGYPKDMYLQKSTGFQEQNDQNVLIVEGYRPQDAFTVILTGPDKSTLKRIKNQFKPLMIMSRHLQLKMQKVWLDQKFIKSMKPESHLKNIYPNIFFSWFNQKHENTIMLIKQRYLSFGRIIFVQGDYGPISFPEISKNVIDEYIKSKTRKFKSKWSNFTEICNLYKEMIRRFYSQQDMPMGEFILRRLLSMNKKCQNCRRPLFQHIEMYYSTNIYVKIELQSRIFQVQQTIHYENEDYLQKLKNEQTPYKIQSFIECQSCHKQLSDVYILSRDHLQLSLFSFLHELFTTTSITLRYEYTENQPICKHHKKSRVFQLGKSMMRVSVHFLTIFKKFQLSNEQRQEKLRQKQYKHIIERCLIQSYKTQQVINFLYDDMKKMAQQVKNPNFQTILLNPKASFLKAKSSFLIGKGSFSAQNQCTQILIPQLIEQINRIKQLSDIFINSKRVKNYLECILSTQALLSILKRLYKIIKQVRTAITRHQLNQKYMANHAQIEQNFIMDEYDINALAQENSESQSQRSIYNMERQKSQQKDDQIQYNKTEIDFQENQFQQWMGNTEEIPFRNKSRKAQSHLGNHRQISKVTQMEVQKIFKLNLSRYKVDGVVVPNLYCNLYQPQSLIANSLNSRIHNQVLIGKKQIDIIRIKFLQSDEQIVMENQQMKKIASLLEMEQKMMKINKEKSSKQNFIQIVLLCPYQFQVFRQSKHISLEQYINTLASAYNWINTGSKSGAPFIRSYNDLLVIKKIQEKEFNNLKKMLPKYFAHMKKQTLLTSIYGAYELHREGNKYEYFIVMQNLFFGMNQWHLYDLTGAQARRFSKPPIIPLDMNFILDRHSQPIFTIDNLMKKLSPTLDFLVQFDIMDYSLILVFNIENQNQEYLDGSSIRIGIINYLRSDGINTRLEKVMKGQWIALDAKGYKDRMISSMRRYFAQIPQ